MPILTWMYSTPDSSTSGGSPAESKTSTLPACEELIIAGIGNVVEGVFKKLLRLSLNGNTAASIVAKFFENHYSDSGDLCDDTEDPTILEFRQMIFKAVDEDPEFISEFSTRTRKILIDFFPRKAHEASVEELIKEFDNV